MTGSTKEIYLEFPWTFSFLPFGFIQYVYNTSSHVYFSLTLWILDVLASGALSPYWHSFFTPLLLGCLAPRRLLPYPGPVCLSSISPFAKQVDLRDIVVLRFACTEHPNIYIYFFFTLHKRQIYVAVMHQDMSFWIQL